MKSILLSLFLLGFTSTIFAQEHTQAAPQAQGQKKNPTGLLKPKLSAPLQNLIKFMGKWQGDITIEKGGKKYTVNFSLIGRSAGAGNGVYLEESFNDAELGAYKGANLVGYDSSSAQIIWYSVDNENPPHEHTGTWAGTDTLNLTHQGTRKGKTYTEKIQFIFKTRNDLWFTFSSTLDGKDAGKASGTFKRDLPKKNDEPQVVPAGE